MPDIECHESLFKVFAPRRKYDNTYMGRVIEHVKELESIISRASAGLNPHRRFAA